jgi:metacaspase-1
VIVDLATATKRALCIGIGDYPVRGRDLKGAVPDAKAWATLLRERFGFDKRDITLLLDAQATRAQILAALDALLSDARSGDVRVFTIACHGTYLADQDDDEADEYDEALCPWDYRKELIRDDELRERLASVRTGVRVVFIVDSCHSGTVTRLLRTQSPPARRPRFMPPNLLGRAVITDMRTRAKPRHTARAKAGAMKELLLSACRSDQYAFDDKVGRTHRGMMSYHAIRLIEQADGDITYSALAKALRRALADAGYDQEPQLEGPVGMKRRKVFT